MVSDREGREKFGRNLETENPDFDRYFAEQKLNREIEERRFETLASDLLKPEQIDKGGAFRKSVAKNVYDPQRRAANIVLKMNADIAKAQVKVKETTGKPHKVKGSFYRFPDARGNEAETPKPEPRPFEGIKRDRNRK